MVCTNVNYYTGADGRLHLPQAPDTPIGKTGSQSKKRKLDETTPKIDMFIEQAAKKKKVSCFFLKLINQVLLYDRKWRLDKQITSYSKRKVDYYTVQTIIHRYTVET